MLILWQRSELGPGSPRIGISSFFFNSAKIYFAGAIYTERCQELIIPFLMLFLDIGASEEELESEEVHSERRPCISALLWPSWGEILWPISPSYWQPPRHLLMGLSTPISALLISPSPLRPPTLVFLPPLSTVFYLLLFAKIWDLRLWGIAQGWKKISLNCHLLVNSTEFVLFFLI